MAWIWAQDRNGMFATAAPVCLQLDGDTLISLVGHLPRSSRLARALTTPVDTLAVVSGPGTYVSPSWFSNRTQAPSWNYASAQFNLRLSSMDDPLFLDRHLRELVTLMEEGRERLWSVDEMGDRYDSLSKRIIAFEGSITSWDGRFKLGQDEPDGTYEEIVAALGDSGADDILTWMKDFNSVR